MANRTGIELVPSHCRIVEVHGSTGAWLGRGGAKAAGTQVRAYRSIPCSPGSPGLLAAELRQLAVSRTFSRRAVVAIWGLRSTHQFLQLPPADAADLESLARREARAAGVSASGPDARMSDGILVGGLREANSGGSRRDVCYVAVSAEEVLARIRPVVEAGFTVEAVVTPAIAHAAVVRLRLAASPDAVSAVLEVNAQVTGLTVIRNGVVLFAREMAWGHDSERSDVTGRPPDPQVLAARLAAELRRSFQYVKQNLPVDPSLIMVCGDVPDIRTLTGPLMHELNVEVETLDSMEGINTATLPEPAEEFRSRMAEFRPAWAIAADSATPINLLPHETRSAVDTKRFESRIAAAVVTALLVVGAGWALATWLAARAQTQLADARRQIAVLEPQVQRLDQERLAAALIGARAAALDAWASQGVRLARILELLGRSAPDEVAITSLKVEPDGAAWKLRVEGRSLAATPTLAQSAFNVFLRKAAASPVLGRQLRSPTMILRSGESDPVQSARLADGANTPDRTSAYGGDVGPAWGGARGMPPPEARPNNVTMLAGAASDLPSPTPGTTRSGTHAPATSPAADDRRRPLVGLDTRWLLHPLSALSPREKFDVESYNARVLALQRGGTGGAVPLAPVTAARASGSTLAFALEFEVRK